MCGAKSLPGGGQEVLFKVDEEIDIDAIKLHLEINMRLAEIGR